MQTLLYDIYKTNLKPTYEIVNDEAVVVPAKIDLDKIDFSLAFMPAEYEPKKEDEVIDANLVIGSFDSFLVNDNIKHYQMSEITDKANEKLGELSEEDKKRVVGFLIYCDAGLCFYEPMTINN